MIERTAEQCIGWDDGKFRVKGGRVDWQAVLYNCANGGRLVRIARLAPIRNADGNSRVREFYRYVEPETILVFPDSAANVFNSPAFGG